MRTPPDGGSTALRLPADLLRQSTRPQAGTPAAAAASGALPLSSPTTTTHARAAEPRVRSPRQARLRDLASIAAATTLVVSAIAALVFLGLSMVGFVNPPANVGGLPAGAFAIPIVILTALAEPDSLEARSDELRA